MIIGITGGMGSGKTTLSNALAEDFPVYFADHLAKACLAQSAVITTLVSKWGKEILHPDNATIDTQKLATLAFQSPADTKFLNSCLHPPTLKSMQELVNRCTASKIIFEVPLLFEADLAACFDLIIVVVADQDLRIKRIKSRDGLSTSQIKSRLDAQLSDSYKAKHADLLIFNNHGLEELKTQIEKLRAMLKTSTNSYRRTRAFADC